MNDYPGDAAVTPAPSLGGGGRGAGATSAPVAPGGLRLARVARNAGWLLLSQGGGRLLGFLAGTLLARQLGPGDFGSYVFIVTFVSYFGFLADGGLGRFLIRDVAREPAKARRYLDQISGLRLALAAGCFALLLVAAVVAGLRGERLALTAVVGGSLFSGALAGALSSMFFAREEMRTPALFGLLSSGATALFLLLVVALDGGLGWALSAVALANLPPLAFLWLLWRRRAPPPRPRADLALWRQALGQSFPYAALGVVGLIYFRIDALLLTWLGDSAATGVYTAAYRLLDAATDAPGVIVAALFPAMARLHHGPRADLRRVYRRMLGILALLGLPVMLGLIALAGPLMGFLYGDAYAGSVTVLRLLAVAVFLIFIDTANTVVLYSGDNLRTVLALSLVTMAANIVLNLLLIPPYGYNGAAVAMILSTALSLAIFTPTVLRYLAHEAASSS